MRGNLINPMGFKFFLDAIEFKGPSWNSSLITNTQRKLVKQT